MIKHFRRKNSREVGNSLEFLLTSQYWDQTDIENYQLLQFKKLIKFSYDNVPYYRNYMITAGLVPEDFESLDSVTLLPVLEKQNIQQSFDLMIATTRDIRSATLNSTGGSTGVPLNFYHDANYKKWSDAARIRAWKYMLDLSSADIEAVFWGAIRDVGKGLSLYRLLRELLRDGCLSLNTFDMDEDTLTKYLRYYNFVKPPLIRGYASSLYYIARFVDSNSIKIHYPKAIISTTEVLHSRMRETIENVFKCKVFDSYGCREVSQIGTECECHDGLHIVFENQYVELEGNDILVTNFNNYIMPFIRYRVGDLASSINWEPCLCGRNSPRIVNLIGRDNDNIELPSGKVINGEFFEFLFFGIKTVIQYQVIHHKKIDLIEVKLHMSNNSVDVGEIVKRTMIEKFDYNKIKIIYTDNFDKSPTGKLRFVYAID